MITDTQVLLALALNALKDNNLTDFSALIDQAKNCPDSDSFILETMTSKMCESVCEPEQTDIEHLASLSRSITRHD